ncbi:hypothetical protein FQR65_LT18339 [Abscondita terminalis]|nr:hypothetical protein FQR65_LT18339 [Abscondita terminalis]
MKAPSRPCLSATATQAPEHERRHDHVRAPRISLAAPAPTRSGQRQLEKPRSRRWLAARSRQDVAAAARARAAPRSSSKPPPRWRWPPRTGPSSDTTATAPHAGPQV